MRFGTLACCFVCVACSVFASARASAQPEEESTPARSHATVKIAGSPGEVTAMAAVLRERVANADTDASIDGIAKVDRSEVLAPPNDESRDLARIWVDLQEDPLVVYVVDDAGQRVLVRTIARGENPEVAREEIGHIVEVALGALHAGERIGVERTELVEPRPEAAPPPRPPEAPPPPAPLPSPPAPRWAFDGSLYYGVRAHGDGLETTSGPGIAIGVDRRFARLRAGGALSAEYRFPSVIEGGPASVRMESYAFHLLAKAELALDGRGRSTLGIAVGPGLELVDAEARDPASASATLSNERTRVDPMIRNLVRYGLATPILRVFAGVGVDVPMRNPSYVLIERGERVVLFAPWVVRPFFVIGIETN